MPVRFLLIAAVVVVLAVVWRRPLVESLRASWRATVAHVRDAGPVHMAALAVIVVAGVVLRDHFLRGPMRWDESYTFLHFGSLPLGQGLSIFDSPNNHALNTALMHVSYTLFGDGEAALRGPVFVAGCLLAPVGYVAAARLYDRRVALVAAAVLATSPQLVEYATNARGYELAALFAVALVAVGPSLLRTTNPAPWALFAVIAALGFYTVSVFAYPFAVIVGALALAGLLGSTEQAKGVFLLRMALVSVAAIGLAVVMYGSIVDDVLGYIDEGGYSDDGWAVVEDTWGLWTLGLPLVAKVLLLAGFAVSAVAALRRDSRTVPLALLFAALVIVALGAGRVVPLTRVFVPLLPIFLIAAIGGLLGLPPLARLLSRRSAEIGVAAVAVAIAVGFGLHVKSDRLADSDGSALPSALSIVDVVKPRLQSTEDQVLISTSAHPILQIALFRAGLPPGYAYGALPPALAETGNTFVVVNEFAGETLQSVLQQTAPGTVLRPDGAALLAEFKGAKVYELRR
jgi:hypothetical protein